MPNSQQKAISRIVKAMKWGAGALFMAANIFLVYNFSTAYSSGQQRAQKLHKERQALKSSGKQSKVKITMPQQTQPEYVEKQVRKYKQLYANSKQKQQRA